MTAVYVLLTANLVALLLCLRWNWRAIRAMKEWKELADARLRYLEQKAGGSSTLLQPNYVQFGEAKVP